MSRSFGNLGTRRRQGGDSVDPVSGVLVRVCLSAEDGPKEARYSDSKSRRGGACVSGFLSEGAIGLQKR